MKRLALALSLLLLTAPGWAAPARYITDDLQVVVRTGATTGHRIIKMLDAGTPVEVLETENGWSRIRTRDGVVGWLESRLIVNTPGARAQLAAATDSLNQLKQALQETKQSLSEQTRKLAEAQAQVAELSTANERMKQQLAEAGRGLALAEENKDLRKQVADLQREAELLRNEVARLQDRSQRDWFVTGALVVFGGFVVGIAVTRIRWKRKSSWSSL